MPELDRPLGVSVLAVLNLIDGILTLVAGGRVVSGPSYPAAFGYGPFTGLTALMIGVLIIFLGIVSFVASWGMWSGRSWAWTLCVVLVGMGIVNSLSLIAQSQVSFVVGLPINSYIIWYLWRPQVKAYFGKGSRTPSL